MFVKDEFIVFSLGLVVSSRPPPTPLLLSFIYELVMDFERSLLC
jgi:hypothetical protein